MQKYDIAIPTLPSRSVHDTLVFYQRLGFDGKVVGDGDSYAILTRGAIEIHFFTHSELRPAESSAGCYVRVLDVREIYEAFAFAKLFRKGIPRMDPLEAKPWGMREFAIVVQTGICFVSGRRCDHQDKGDMLTRPLTNFRGRRLPQARLVQGTSRAIVAADYFNPRQDTHASQDSKPMGRR